MIRKIVTEEETKRNKVNIGYQKIIIEKQVQRWSKEKGVLKRVHQDTNRRETVITLKTKYVVYKTQ